MLRPTAAFALTLLTTLTASGCVIDTEFGIDDGESSLAQELGDRSDVDVYFNAPELDGRDRTIERKLIDLIERAAPKSKIRGSYFHFSSSRVAAALIEAKTRRDVDVRLVLNDPSPDEDEDERGDAVLAMLRQGLGKKAVDVCRRGKGACIGDRINHNKLMLFSELSGGASHVVVQSSANLGGGRLHNNMLVFENNKALYDQYLAYWKDLRAGERNLAYARNMDARNVKAYVSPRAEGDPVLDVLAGVKCTKGQSRIRVAMSLFSAERLAIAQRLAELDAAGCNVKVLVREAGNGAAPQVVSTLRAGKVDVREFPSARGNIHSKYLLIDSPYGADSQPRRIVLTGSHNYTGEALRNNDEVLIQVEDDKVFARYLANWKTIRSQIDSAR